MAKEYIEREAVCYQLAKQATIDGQPRAIKRAAKIVADFPAADVRPVVRCKDCRFCVHDSGFDELWCNGKRRKADWYCADGERSTNCGALMDKDGDGDV